MGELPANRVVFDKSSRLLAVGCEDGSILIYNIENETVAMNLKGHEEGVQDLVFDITNKMIVSAGADNSFRLWQ